jgi:LacI family transcriptional regulator
MKDVATRAGVALKTVSRVVNGEPGVTPATATRVLDAIEDLGFRRNESARLLRTGRTSALGIIAEDFADADTAALCRGIEEVARDHGMLLFTGSTDGAPDEERRLALSLTARRVDGLVIMPTPGDHSYLVPEIEAGTATVFVLRPPSGTQADTVPANTVPADTVPADTVPADTVPADTVPADTVPADTVPADTLSADTVLADERGGARAAVTHLISHGHRRIGLLSGDPGTYRSRELRQGYADAMAKAGLMAEDAWTTLTAHRLLDSPVTAVFCGDRSQTLLALHALTAADQSSEIALVGFGDFPLAEYVRPGLTVISYDPAEAGRTAAGLLFRRLDGDGGPARRAVVPMKLIARGSGEVSPPVGRVVSPRSPAR